MVTLALSLLLAAAPACPPERQVALTPQAWKAQLERARPADYETVLARLGLRPFPAGYTHVRLQRVDLFPAHLVSAAEQDWVVQARFSAALDPGDEGLSKAATVYRIQVLRPEGRGFCAAGADLSADQPAEALNAGPADGMHDSFGPITFGFVHLTSAAHQTIEVTQTSETFSRVTGTSTRHTFWDVREGRLTRVLEVARSDLRSGFFEFHHQRDWFELSGPPPRRVRVFEERCEPEEPGPACAPLEVHQFPFADGRYGPAEAP